VLQLEKYKAKRSSKDKGENMEYVEQSDDESLHDEKSMLHKESGVREKSIITHISEYFFDSQGFYIIIFVFCLSDNRRHILEGNAQQC